MLKKAVNAWTVVRCLVISFALLFGFASGYADGRNFAKRQFERDTQLRDGVVSGFSFPAPVAQVR